MKRIQHINDLNKLANKMSSEFLEYLTDEFYDLYEYYSNGELLEEFQLEGYQAIIILEEASELGLLMRDNTNIEYIDEIELRHIVCLRIGINQLEDIQIHYFLKREF